MRIGDVANENRRAVDDADRHIVELVEALRRTVERDDIFELADLFGADRRDDVLPADRVDDVLRRQPVGLQLVLIDVDLDLEDLAAVRRGNRRAGDGASCGRMKFWPASKICACDSALLDSASWMTGTLEALKLRTKGGVIPGGRYFRTVCEAAVVLRQRGVDVDARWKNTLTTP